MPSEKFERKVLITAVVAAAGIAHNRLVILTKACQQTNTPNTHSLSILLHTSWCCMVLLCFRALIECQIVLCMSSCNHTAGLLPH